MKKLLVLAMVIALFSCSASTVFAGALSNAFTEDTPEDTVSTETAPKHTADDGQAEPILDWEELTVYLTRYEISRYGESPATMKLLFWIENNSDTSVDIWLNDTTIDGVEVLGAGLFDIKAHSTRGTRPGTEEDKNDTDEKPEDEHLDYCLVISKSSNKDEGSNAIQNAKILNTALLVKDSETDDELLLKEVTIDLDDLDGERNIVEKATTSAPAPTTTAEPTTPAPSYRVLSQGSSGEDVRKLQQKLIELGYLNDVADGSYGPNTASAVLEFNNANGLGGGRVADQITQDLLFSGLAKAYTEPWMPLVIGPNFKYDPVPSANTFFFSVEVTNHSKTRTIKGFELWCYYTNVWGQKLDNGVTYTQTTNKKVGPGQTVLSSSMNLGNWYSTDIIWVGISKIVFDDGEIRENNVVEYYSCQIIR